MKISTDTIQTLKYFSEINNSIVIQPGNLISTKTPDGSAIFGVAKVKEEFSDTIAIFDLAQFLNVWSAFSDPELEVYNGKQAKIIEGKLVAKYTFAEPSLIPKAPTQIAEQPVVASFHLKSDQLTKLIRMASAMGLEDVVIKGDGVNLTMSTLTTKSPSSNSFDISVGDTDSEFLALVKLLDLKIPPRNDYKVTVTERYIRFEADCENQGIDSLVYWVGLGVGSKFNAR